MKLPNVAETLMLAFDGMTAPAEVLDRLRDNPPAGYTVFSYDNTESAEQTVGLIDALQDANPGALPLLIGADQEGGQLIALVGTTDFPGNMALGAAGDPDLTEQVGRAIALEMLAMGANLNYAPIADLNTNPANPSLGVRAFGDDASSVADHVAAFVRGSRSAGVLTTLKHFPGKGAAEIDSHFGLPVIRHDRERLDSTELVPFAAGIEAGADLAMTGHFSIPGITERDDIASTLSRAVLTDLLRGDLGFKGAVITDAFDMGAIAQGAGRAIDAIAAIRAGVDLMLLTRDNLEQVEQALALACHRGLIPDERLAGAIARSRALRRWVAGFERPDRSIIGSPEHRELAKQVAERSITLVRDHQSALPIRLDGAGRIAVIMPQPRDLTPADTSALVTPALAPALRVHHSAVDEFVVSHPPTDDEIADVSRRVADYDLVVLGTISASMDPRQADLGQQVLRAGEAADVPVVVVALRTPYDLLVLPEAGTYVCAYGLRRPSMDAVAAALFGAIPFRGHLPVTLSDEYPLGFGITKDGAA